MQTDFEKKYVVLDVETNGLKSKECDLLSISIFRPDTNQTYNRFLPLSLQRNVLTTEHNGITKDMLYGKEPLSQDEVDQLISSFDLENRTILTYGGLDARFIKAYFLRNKLRGIEHFHFYNFKRDIASTGFTYGTVSKDNLCKMVGIKNVKTVHSGLNDCVLEWELFKAMDGHKWLITNSEVFEFNDNYIIPAGLLVNCRNFRHIKPDLPIPKPNIVEEKIFSFDGEDIKRFENNISGISVEHLLDAMLKTKNVDSYNFLLENKKKLRYIGMIPNPYVTIPVALVADGTMLATRKEDVKLVEDINRSSLMLKERIGPFISYLREEVFHGKQILSQELVINRDDNVLALCDFSNEDAAIELKTFYADGYSYDRGLHQLYYEANGRDAYFLVIDWNNELRRKAGSINFILRKVTFELLTAEEAKVRTPSPLSDKNLQVVKYTNSKLPVTIHCKKCGHDFVAPGSRYRTKKCPYCHPKTVSVKIPNPVSKVTMDHDFKFQRYASKVERITNGNVVVLAFNGSSNPATLKCKNCGHVWARRASSVIQRFHCPNCGK
jgi:Zn finger protein HypA/HybF involved in hydrogenase expression/DNA polymerase III epsilon subunit-like protein